MLKVPVCNRQGDSAMELDITSSTSLESDSVIAKSSHKMAAGDSKTFERSSSDGPLYNYRQNHVSHVMLAGVHIVSLHIDGRERLCLAQISNTLLKQFSYNEIHNRRVALGITCVQCTPVQLEILRRAGAMPISSRRCGMITKREAERLVKSFLEDNKPPKLPENFFFEVHHQCGWGCRGKFEPARYNSSRAKCIKCSFCNLYFSPNKFIFHFHRAPDSKYSHPDAANFNSWRRHLHLVEGTDSDEAVHAWEDVKAMFNGGSRKRMVSSPPFQSNRLQQAESPEAKKQKIQVEDTILAKPNFRPPYQTYPMFTMPGNTYPFSPLAAPNPLALSYHLGKSDVRDERKPHNLPVPWRPTSDFIIPTYDFLWTNQFGARPNGLQGFRPNYFPTHSSPVKDLSMSESDRKTPSDNINSSEDEENLSPLNVPMDTLKSTTPQRLSAFKPVLKFSEHTRTSSSECQPPVYGRVVDKDQDIETDDLDVGIDEEYVEDSDKALDLAAHQTKTRAYSPDTSVCTNDTNVANTGDVSDGTVDACETTQKDEATDRMAKEDTCNNDNNDGDINSNKEPCVNLENINKMSKGDLQRLLEREMDLRRQVENDINKLKEKLNDQIVQQKPEVDQTPLGSECTNTVPANSTGSTDVLCFELEQERKMRFSMQQKLKEAQMTLHGLSGKGLSGMACTDCPFPNTSTGLPR